MKLWQVSPKPALISSCATFLRSSSGASGKQQEPASGARLPVCVNVHHRNKFSLMVGNSHHLQNPLFTLNE